MKEPNFTLCYVWREKRVKGKGMEERRDERNRSLSLIWMF
jgi:hypothetical protein